MEAEPPNVQVCTTSKVKSPEKKKKKRSETKEAVRRRRQRLRENEDFQAVLAEELEKASGGGECKECRGYLVELGSVYKQNADLTREFISCVCWSTWAHARNMKPGSLTCKIPSTA
jgi:hypothetical protein